MCVFRYMYVIRIYIVTRGAKLLEVSQTQKNEYLISHIHTQYTLVISYCGIVKTPLEIDRLRHRPALQLEIDRLRHRPALQLEIHVDRLTLCKC